VTAEVEDQPGDFLAYCKRDQEIPNDAIRVGARLRLCRLPGRGPRFSLVSTRSGVLKSRDFPSFVPFDPT
jgi:hypothetical protein